MTDVVRLAEIDRLRGEHVRRTLVLPDGLSYEQWAAITSAVEEAEDDARWWVGDALLYGDEHFGEDRAGDVFKSWTKDGGTIANYKWVAKVFPPEQRDVNLHWTHYREVAAVEDPVERREWLLRAESAGWSSRELAAARRRHEQAITVGEPVPPDPDPEPDPEERLVRRVEFDMAAEAAPVLDPLLDRIKVLAEKWLADHEVDAQVRVA